MPGDAGDLQRHGVGLQPAAKGGRAMTIPFGEPEPSDALLNKSVSSDRLRFWLNTRLRLLAREQRIQDARALRGEFSLD